MPAGTRNRAPRKAKVPETEPLPSDRILETVGDVLEGARPTAKANKRTNNNKRNREDADSDVDASPTRKKTNVAGQAPPLPPAPPKIKPAPRGRKAKVPDVELPPPEHSSNAVDAMLEDEHMAVASDHTSIKKRNHEDADSNIDTEPPKKKGREIATPPKLQTPLKDKPALKGRSPLPQRDGRNKHPGARVAPKKKRTSAEVAADKAAKEEKKHRLAELEVEKRVLLAQMELEEEEQDLEHEINMVRRLSDVRFIKPGGHESESEGEVFDLNVESSEPEDVEMAEADEKQKPTTTKARQAGVAATKNAKNKGVVGEKKKTATRKGDKVLASGLIQNWAKHTKDKQKSSDDSKPGLGGLTDADAQATKPDFGVPQEIQQTETTRFNNTHNRSRKNTDVAPVLSEQEVEQKPIVPKKPRPTKRPSKQEQSQPSQPQLHPRALNGNTVQVTDLPEFTEVDSKWRKVFIPSLYSAFFCSSAPFKDFIVGSTSFIQIVQDVVDRVYPEVKYTVKRDDPIHLIAYNRINEKRSNLGSDAINSVKIFLKDDTDIRTWCRWAKRVDGPMFYSKPTPKSCPIDPKHEDYIRPEGRLQSSFIVKLAKDYLCLVKGAINKGQRPVGLFALILAALERAVRGYVKGVWTAPKEFSEKCFGDRVAEYAASCSKVKDCNWQDILDACGTAHNPDDDLSDNEMADVSLLDRQRGALFDFSSPVKG